jgi:motility quorum-sensing regulator / GCU-specific mRNA interferase toxin
MEKRAPHCKLPVVKALIEQGKVQATVTALGGAEAMGFDFDDMIAVVMALTTTISSSTTYTDQPFRRATSI